MSQMIQRKRLRQLLRVLCRVDARRRVPAFRLRFATARQVAGITLFFIFVPSLSSPAHARTAATYGQNAVGADCNNIENATDFDALAQCNSSTGAGTMQTAPIVVGTVTTPPYAATTCDANKAGMIQWTGTAMQYCDGADWESLATSTCDNTSTNLNLGDLTNLVVNTLTNSYIALVTGMDASCPVTVGVSGTGGNPEYRVCSDAACSIVTTDWTNGNNTLDMQGKYIQLRATSSASVTTSFTITAAVGTTSSNWTISTARSVCFPEGTVCSDGTIYAGLSGASTPMYTTPCDYGRTGTQGACTGSTSPVPWNNGNSTGVTTTGVVGRTDGKSYSATINSRDADSLVALTQPHRAAASCEGLSAYGHSDWYLPSQTELHTLYQNNAAIGGFYTSGSPYWASRENGASLAYAEQFSDGNQVSAPKSITNFVRCVRR